MTRCNPKVNLQILGYIGVIGGMGAWVLFVVPSDLGATIFSGPLGLAIIGYSILLLQKTVIKIDQAAHFIRLHHDSSIFECFLEKITR
jgi:hypothetical protein